MSKEFYTKEELESAQDKDILHFLKSEGYEFIQEGHEYRSKEHSSLIINEDGRWYWNSKDVSGRKPVELLKQLLIHDSGYSDKDAYITAIKRLAGTEGMNIAPDNYRPPKPEPKPEDKAEFILPPANKNNNRIINYLCNTRKVDRQLVNELIENGQLYETKFLYSKKEQKYIETKNHNACFVLHDKSGQPSYGFIKGTAKGANGKTFQQDLTQDKSQGLISARHKESTKVYCFESFIDGLSHATLYKMSGLDYKDGYRLSLHGTSFNALNQFLEDNPQVTEIVSCLDNDETGIRRTQKLCAEYSEKGYKTFMQLSATKDYNEQLVDYVTTQEQEIEVSQEME